MKAQAEKSALRIFELLKQTSEKQSETQDCDDSDDADWHWEKKQGAISQQMQLAKREIAQQF